MEYQLHDRQKQQQDAETIQLTNNKEIGNGIINHNFQGRLEEREKLTTYCLLEEACTVLIHNAVEGALSWQIPEMNRI